MASTSGATGAGLCVAVVVCAVVVGGTAEVYYFFVHPDAAAHRANLSRGFMYCVTSIQQVFSQTSAAVTNQTAATQVQVYQSRNQGENETPATRYIKELAQATKRAPCEILNELCRTGQFSKDDLDTAEKIFGCRNAEKRSDRKRGR